MKQKYLLLKNLEENKFVIREFGELDNGIYSLLCEVDFDMETVTAAAEADASHLLEVIRSHNLYPTEFFGKQIAEAVKALLDSNTEESAELFFSDMDAIESRLPVADEDESEDGDSDESISDLLDDSLEDDDNFDEVDELSSLDSSDSSSVKVADDDGMDVDI